MLITLNETKEYLRVDGDEEDNLITSLINAAEVYLKNATGKTFDSSNELARLFCLVLVVDWYENRTYIAGKVGDNVNFLDHKDSSYNSHLKTKFRQLNTFFMIFLYNALH